MGPEKAVMPRYEIRNGRYGAYFYDREFEVDMDLQAVLRVMNNLEVLINAVKRALALG